MLYCDFMNELSCLLFCATLYTVYAIIRMSQWIYTETQRWFSEGLITRLNSAATRSIVVAVSTWQWCKALFHVNLILSSREDDRHVDFIVISAVFFLLISNDVGIGLIRTRLLLFTFDSVDTHIFGSGCQRSYLCPRSTSIAICVSLLHTFFDAVIRTPLSHKHTHRAKKDKNDSEHCLTK